MSIIELFFIISMAAPAMTAFICLGFILMRLFEKDKTKNVYLLKLLMVYYIMIVFVSVASFSFIYLKPLYVYVNFFSMLSILYSIIIIYHIIYLVTNVDKRTTFSYWHYLSPILILIIQYVFSYSILPGFNIALLYTPKWFVVVSSFKLCIWMVYGTVYLYYGLRRILKYRNIIKDYSADEDRTSLRWLILVIILTFSLIPPTVLYVFFRDEEVMISLFLAIIHFIFQLQLIIIVYNVFTDNYIIMYPVGVDLKEEKLDYLHIDKAEFEKLIREKKPYLNPSLKITDLMFELCTNRTYLSTFINKTYGMSFSRYINSCRLIELKQLEKEPVKSDYDKEMLVLRAGFRSYRGYKHFVDKLDGKM